MSTSPNFCVEIHPPDWRFSAEKSWIAGWLQSSAGQVITDVRARIGHRVILGLSGLPHPALPSAGQPHGAGFSFLFSPQRGATTLRLEARNQHGRWTEFFRTRITPAPDAPAHVPPAGFSAALGRLTAALLRLHLLVPHWSRRELADELVAAFVAEPLDADPNPPFVGALEEPRTTGRLRYGCVPVTGWLAHPTAKIVRLAAVIDPLPGLTLPADRPRSDISGAFPALDGQNHSVFAGEVALPVGLVAPALLKIFAELANGESHLVFARRFTPLLHGDSGELPHLVSATDFVRTVRALHAAAGRQGLPRTGMIRAAQAIWSAYLSVPRYGEKNPPPDCVASPASVPPPPAPDLTLIDPADGMQVPDRIQYFTEGRDALVLVQAAVAQAGGRSVGSILDLPCGFGRIGRWFRTAYPAALLTACDTQAPGVDFCTTHLGAAGVTAQTDGRHWAQLPGPYDVIWCGSLLTHLGRGEWIDHLRRFEERLAPQGVLVFTSHGLLALEHLRSGEKNYGLQPDAVAQLRTSAVAGGFGYADYADTAGYGISVAQTGWIRELVAKETNLVVLAIHEAGWSQHQDVVICTRRAAPTKSRWRNLFSRPTP